MLRTGCVTRKTPKNTSCQRPKALNSATLEIVTAAPATCIHAATKNCRQWRTIIYGNDGVLHEFWLQTRIRQSSYGNARFQWECKTCCLLIVSKPTRTHSRYSPNQLNGHRYCCVRVCQQAPGYVFMLTRAINEKDCVINTSVDRVMLYTADRMRSPNGWCTTCQPRNMSATSVLIDLTSVIQEIHSRSLLLGTSKSPDGPHFAPVYRKFTRRYSVRSI